MGRGLPRHAAHFEIGRIELNYFYAIVPNL